MRLGQGEKGLSGKGKGGKAESERKKATPGGEVID